MRFSCAYSLAWQCGTYSHPQFRYSLANTSSHSWHIETALACVGYRNCPLPCLMVKGVAPEVAGRCAHRLAEHRLGILLHRRDMACHAVASAWYYAESSSSAPIPGAIPHGRGHSFAWGLTVLYAFMVDCFCPSVAGPPRRRSRYSMRHCVMRCFRAKPFHDIVALLHALWWILRVGADSL